MKLLAMMVVLILTVACAQTPAKEDFQAAHHGDLARLGGLSDQEINRPNKNGTTLLMVAARNGNLESVQYLLSRKASVKALDQNKQNVLHYATLSHNSDVISELIRAGADPSACDQFDATPIEMWAESGEFNLMRLSLAHLSNWCCFETVKPELVRVLKAQPESNRQEANTVLSLINE